MDADDNSRKYGVGVLLDSLIFLDTLNLAYELKDPGVRGQLVELAQDKLNDEDMAIRRKAHLGMCLSLTHDYSIDPTDEKFAKVLDQFKLSVPTLSDDVPSVVSLGRLIELVKNSPRQDHVVELMNVAGAEFKKSNIEMVRSVGAKFHDDIVLGEFDFAAIGEQMLMGDEESLKRLALAMDVVTRNPQISGIAFSKVLSLTDNLSQIGKEELELEYVKRLRDASNNVTDEDLSAGIQEVWANYDKRNALSGKTFDLTADQLHGQPLDMERLKGKIVAVIFFGQRHGKSLDLIARLHDYEYLISEGVEFVLCSIDEHPKPELLSPLTKVRGINLVTKFGARAYREQCPVSNVPYTLILNRQHTVVATNIHEDDLRTRLEQLVKAGE